MGPTSPQMAGTGSAVRTISDHVGAIWSVKNKNAVFLKLLQNDLLGAKSRLEPTNVRRHILFITYRPHEHRQND